MHGPCRAAAGPRVDVARERARERLLDRLDLLRVRHAAAEPEPNDSSVPAPTQRVDGVRLPGRPQRGSGVAVAAVEFVSAVPAASRRRRRRRRRRAACRAHAAIGRPPPVPPRGIGDTPPPRWTLRRRRGADRREGSAAAAAAAARPRRRA